MEKCKNKVCVYSLTYEECKKESLKYKSRKDLKENNLSVFYKIYRHKWIELFKHMQCGCKPSGYWDYDRCKKEALKYSYKSQLKRELPTVYMKINKNKWYELFEHMIPLGNRHRRMIYSYEFEDNHVYVGLTYNLAKRNNEHLHTQSKSAVYKHISETSLIPSLVKKTDYIDVNKAVILEGEILSEYIEKGWCLLNVAKTGSIGNSTLKWNKEAIRSKIIQYNTITTFKNKYSGAYISMIHNGWRTELCSHMYMSRSKPGYWNDYERCKTESLKYKTRTELCRNNWSAWSYSKKNGWLDEFYAINK